MKPISQPLRSVTVLKEEIKDWNKYPFSVPAIKDLTAISIASNVVFFCGENGSGKSTLLEAIALNFGFNAEGGSKNINHLTSENASTDLLSKHIKLTWNEKPLRGFFLRSESFFNIGSYLDKLATDPLIGSSAYSGYDFISPHARSHGELFLTIFQNQFSKKGFYILDEPEAALSPKRQLTFLAILNDLIKNNPHIQFIIATHSPIILSYPNSQILSFDNGQITEVEYENTEVLQITKDFLASPTSFYNELNHIK